ncbi:hypothetical protein DL93DRAFT_2088338 [Clavulina sp. PMI_390]|nr:hypothetical protein DL93DRAFT_2088338 [Clavulina sp. PMI_390]
MTTIGKLPPELLYQTIHLAVGLPSERRQTLALLSVCRIWRAVILDMSELFVSPDWAAWPADTIAQWTLRAGDRLLDGLISHQGDMVSLHTRLELACTALLPFAARLQTLRVQIHRIMAPEAFQQLLRAGNMPQLESIVIGYVECDVEIDASSMPRLHTLHAGGLRLRVRGNFPLLRQLGWRLSAPEDLDRLISLLEFQTLPFHLTIFGHHDMQLFWPFEFNAETRTCWAHLTSLRIQGFGERDAEHFGTIARQLWAPNLRQLEIIEVEPRIFGIIILKLPSETSSAVQTLLLGYTGDRPHDLSFYLTLLLGDDSYQADDLPPLPNLVNLVVRDLTDAPGSGWNVDFHSLEQCVRRRHGTLQRLILPSRYRPSSMMRRDNRRVSRARISIQDTLLTDRDERLREEGGLKEISYAFSIDHHGFDIEQPRYF